MQELFDICEEQERVILVAVQRESDDDTEKSVDELGELADTAGALTV